jgi:hypothetical protein
MIVSLSLPAVREEEDEAGLPVGWGESAGNIRADADLRFGRAIIIHNGKTYPIRWLNSAATLRPFEREHLSPSMQTLRRQLHALNNAHSAVAHDLSEADGRLAQLNCLVMRVSKNDLKRGLLIASRPRQ